MVKLVRLSRGDSGDDDVCVTVLVEVAGVEDTGEISSRMTGVLAEVATGRGDSEVKEIFRQSRGYSREQIRWRERLVDR